MINFFVNAQKHTISGYIKDAESSESLIGGTLYETKKQQGITANAYGFYSLTLSEDTVNIICSYVGYQSQTIHFLLKRDTLIQVKLKSSSLLDEVIVKGDKEETPLESSRMGSVSIPISQIKAVPAFFGEVDVMKVLQLLPGVQSGEGSTGLYVRGGGPDQNLILLDGVPVYNASHLYGFFSTFNADAINHVELIKGGFPARYGGRLSSVIDIQMKEGNQSKLHGEASIGIVSSKFTLEGPIVKDRTSFIISARRTFLNLLNTPVLKTRLGGLSGNYFFYDLNAKVNHRINKNNRFYLSAYNGADKNGSETNDSYTDDVLSYSSQSASKLGWGNTILATRWNHVFSRKIFSNLAVTYSKYHYGTTTQSNTTTIKLATDEVKNQFYDYHYYSGIEDFAGSYDVEIIPLPSHYIRTGVRLINHHFKPGALGVKSNNEITDHDFNAEEISANEINGYVEDDWEITSRFKMNAGLHVAAFFVNSKNYNSLQPRLSTRYLLSPQWSVKASYASMQQFVHLLSTTGVGMPTDLWVPATDKVKPQTSWQGAAGMVRTFSDKFEISLEAYYKEMNNLIEYKDGASYLTSDQDWQNKIETGHGKSYGVELLLQKKIGRLSGWLGYTLSKTERQFDNLNEGKCFPYRYDRRHDAKVVVSYALNKRFDLGMTWVYGSGNAVTVPLDIYPTIDYGGFLNNQIHFNSGDADITGLKSRNNLRMSAYHRMDLNLNYTVRKKYAEHKFSLSVYNAYNRKNPFYLYLGYGSGTNNSRARQLEQMSLFTILPSLTYSIKF